MPRNISFSMTTPQFIDGSKDITRRFAWWDAKPGDIYMGVEKAMGLKKGEKIKQLGLIEVVTARRERIDAMITDEKYGLDELRREGFPFDCKTPGEFVEILCKKSGKKPHDEVNRIEFKRLVA